MKPNSNASSPIEFGYFEELLDAEIRTGVDSEEFNANWIRWSLGDYNDD